MTEIPKNSEWFSKRLGVSFEENRAIITFAHPLTEGPVRTIELSTSFVVEHGEPLYIGLINIHQEDPTVLPKVVEDIRQFRDEAVIFPAQDILLWSAIMGIEDIIEGRDDRPPGHTWRLHVPKD